MSHPATGERTGAGFGWAVLALVFLDELLAVAAIGVWGWHVGSSAVVSLALAVLLPLAAVTVWSLFASPKARHGGPALRPVVKVLVFGLACLALWDAGHPGWALALLVFSIAVNATAQLPSVRALHQAQPG